MIPMAKPIINAEELAAVEAVLKSGLISHGEKVDQFEEAFASLIGTTYAVAVNSGTAALYIALLAHGVGPGDEVITTPFSFIATANSIWLTGARPVFADIDGETLNIDPADVLSKVTPRTKAIMPVHLYGQPADMGPLMEIAGRYNLAVIEDACQAHCAGYRGRNAGTFGTGCFSFYPTKNMTTGEGGMLTTNDRAIAEKAKVFRNHGMKQRYYHESLGFNYRMTNMSGALGLCQIKNLPEWNARRQGNAEFLTRELRGLDGLVTPPVKPYATHVFHQYTVRVTEGFGLTRDGLRERLKANGIMTEVYYPVPIHQQSLYRDFGYTDHLPVSEKASREVVSLPVHPSLTGEDLAYIARTIIESKEMAKA
ncbi:MAG: DegT/DnrJ/EryC1/StrS family aminotransferase [Chloroflexi bacterium]|nr:DegT/DnrJ/EryC1/StrS family aminotransferase [Chloroflexota bacterium]